MKITIAKTNSTVTFKNNLFNFSFDYEQVVDSRDDLVAVLRVLSEMLTNAGIATEDDEIDQVEEVTDIFIKYFDAFNYGDFSITLEYNGEELFMTDMNFKDSSIDIGMILELINELNN